MNFYKNKFLIILGSVTAVVTVIFVVFGIKASTRYELAEEDFQAAQSEMKKLTSKPIKPTDDNVTSKQVALREFTEEVTDLQVAFDPYRRPSPVAIDPTAFVDSLLESKDQLFEAFGENKVKVPDQFALGMGRYTIEQPARSETGRLNFALGAFEELFGYLASSAPTEVINIAWGGLPRKEVKDENNRNRNRARNRNKEISKEPAFHRHSLEITFRGSEAALRGFLESLDDSQSHFYVLRVMRVENSRTTAPNAKDATFESREADTGGGSDGLTGGFSFEDFVTEDPAIEAEEEKESADGTEGEDVEGEAAEGAGDEPAAEKETTPAVPQTVDSGEILKQVLGSENINVFMQIDVIQFLEPKEIPEI